MYKTPPLYNETIPIHDDLSLMKRKKERQAPEANEKMKNDLPQCIVQLKFNGLFIQYQFLLFVTIRISELNFLL